MSERLLNGLRDGADTMFDLGRNLADIGDRLAPVVEHPQIPIEPLLKLCVFSAGLAVIAVNCLLKRLVFLANALAHLALPTSKPLEALDDLRPLLSKIPERRREGAKQLVLGLRPPLGLEGGDRRFNLRDRRSPLRHFGREVSDVGLIAPRLRVEVEIGTRPYRRQREARHLKLMTWPIRVGIWGTSGHR